MYQHDYRYCHSEMDNQRRAIEESRTINLRYFAYAQYDNDGHSEMDNQRRTIEESPVITLLLLSVFAFLPIWVFKTEKKHTFLKPFCKN